MSPIVINSGYVVILVDDSVTMTLQKETPAGGRSLNYRDMDASLLWPVDSIH